MGIRNGNLVLAGSSIGFTHDEPRIPEQVYCPNIGTTLPRTSCEDRQKDPSMLMCQTDAHGNCRAKRLYNPGPSAEARKKMRDKAKAKRDQAEARAAQIVGRYVAGEHVDDIADELGVCRELVYRRLRESNIFQRPPSLAQRAQEWLERHPDATNQDIMKKFGCALSTASSYRTRFLNAAQKGEKR